MSEVGLKFDQGKLRWDLVPPEFEEVVKVLTFGANKYADRNWEKGIKYGRVVGAALRHLFSFMRGERLDPETGLHHLAHLGCCVLFLLTYELRGMDEFNDLPAFSGTSNKDTSASRSRAYVLASSIKETRRPVEVVTPSRWPSSSTFVRQTEQHDLDPLDCCEYSGA